MYRLPGVSFIVHDVMTDTFQGPLRVRYISVIPAGGPMPSIVAASVMLCELKSGMWVLGHLLLDDEARGMGLATAIVLQLEKVHGRVSAIWCTPAGESFANKFVAQFGPRPCWRIGGYSNAELQQRIAMMKNSEAIDG